MATKQNFLFDKFTNFCDHLEANWPELAVSVSSLELSPPLLYSLVSSLVNYDHIVPWIRSRDIDSLFEMFKEFNKGLHPNLLPPIIAVTIQGTIQPDSREKIERILTDPHKGEAVEKVWRYLECFIDTVAN